MIYIDGIITKLQRAGGVSVCFSELLTQLEKSNQIPYKFINYGSNLSLKCENIPNERLINPSQVSLLQRYRDYALPTSNENHVFHSSYYRLPKNIKSTFIVTTVHDFVYEKYAKGIKKLIHHWQKRRAILKSDVVVCISENTKEDLLEFIPEAKNKDIRVVYNGVSDNYFPVELQKKDDVMAPYLLYVGARNTYKNFDKFVKSSSQISEFKLVIVGGGKLTEEESKLLVESGFCDFKHYDFVNDEKLNDLYNNAFALVYCSLYEGFGIPVIEAMKAGCPVIAMNASSIPEVSGNAAILLEKLDKEAISGAIEKLKIPSFRNNLIKKGFENSARFSWEKNTREILSIYEELIKKGVHKL